jgi:cytochrome b561
MFETRDRYTGVARALHWTMALLVIAMIPAGFVLLSLPAGPIQDTAFNLHRSTGVLLFVLTALRLAWRLSHPPPPLPASIPAAQRAVAHLVHVALYALLFAMPVIGWWATSAYGAPIIVFGLFELPPLVAKDEALALRAFALHGYVGIALALLIAAHAGAALHHHFIKRDGVLRRML